MVSPHLKFCSASATGGSISKRIHHISQVITAFYMAQVITAFYMAFVIFVRSSTLPLSHHLIIKTRPAHASILRWFRLGKWCVWCNAHILSRGRNGGDISPFLLSEDLEESLSVQWCGRSPVVGPFRFAPYNLFHRRGLRGQIFCTKLHIPGRTR
jgi:hypothetical protein